MNDDSGNKCWQYSDQDGNSDHESSSCHGSQKDTFTGIFHGKNGGDDESLVT